MYGYNLGLQFESVVERNSDNVALKFDCEDYITYDDLNRKVNKITRLLLEKGINPKDVVAISSIKIKNTYASIIACLKIGAIYTMVDRFSPAERLEKLITNCKPKILLFDKELREKIVGQPFVEDKTVILIEDIDALSKNHCDSNLKETKLVSGTNPAYIMYTSGSTGFPKGAVMSHANVLNFISWSIHEFNLTSDDVLTNLNPLFFDNSVFDLYSSLFTGASLVPFDRKKLRNPKIVVDLIDSLKCTTWFSVPSLLIYVNSFHVFHSDNMKFIKRIIFGGEGFPKPKLKLLYDFYSDRAEFINVYGPTECTCICSAYRITVDDLNPDDSVGIPALGNLIPNFEYLILDENDNDVGLDEAGELCLLGPQVGFGYYNDPERTVKSFVQNPFNKEIREMMYKTGDLVKCNGKDGYLYFVSRKDYQIKHMGYRIELGEIEFALNTLSYVSEAATIFGDFNGTNQIVAVVKLNGDVEETVIKSDIKKIIPDYMIPRKIFKVKEILKNSNGKIDRRGLAETYLS